MTLISALCQYPKSLKSVVKYPSSSRHDDKYSRPNKIYKYYPNQPKNFRSFPNIKQSFWEERQTAVLSKEILGVQLSNSDIKDLSLKVDKFKAENIQKLL